METFFSVTSLPGIISVKKEFISERSYDSILEGGRKLIKKSFTPLLFNIPSGPREENIITYANSSGLG